MSERPRSGLAVCPSCGMVSADSPHGTSEQCIRALEGELRRLTKLLAWIEARSPGFPGEGAGKERAPAGCPTHESGS